MTVPEGPMKEHVRVSLQMLYDRNRAYINDLNPEVIEPGYTRSTVTIPENATNTGGGTFGGFLMAIIDVVGSTITWSYGKHAVTQTCSVNFIRGVSIGEKLVLEARNVHFGRTTCVSEVVVSDEQGKVRLTSTCTLHIVADIKPDDAIVKEAYERAGLAQGEQERNSITREKALMGAGFALQGGGETNPASVRAFKLERGAVCDAAPRFAS